MLEEKGAHKNKLAEIYLSISSVAARNPVFICYRRLKEIGGDNKCEQVFGRLPKAFSCIGIALLCAACGGGGSDSPPTGASQPVIPTRPPSATDPLALTTANAGDAATLVLGFTETALAFGQIASDWTQAMRLASGTLPQTTACPGGGSQSLALLDSDASGSVSKGDTIQGALANCYPALEGVVTGNAVLQITNFNEGSIRDGGSLTLGPTFGFADSGVNINFGGSFQYALTDGRLGTALRVTSPNWSVSLTNGSVSVIDTVRDIDGHHDRSAVMQPALRRAS